MNLLWPRTRERQRARHHSKFGTGSPEPAIRYILMDKIGDVNIPQGRHPRYDDGLPEREVRTCRNLAWFSSSMRTSPSVILMRSWSTPTRVPIYHLWTVSRGIRKYAWGFIIPDACSNGSPNIIRNTSIGSRRFPRAARWKWWAAVSTNRF